MSLYTEEDVTNVLNVLVNSEYKLIYWAVLVFQIPPSTLQNQLWKPKLRKESHISQQLLTSIKESTLKNWIFCTAKLEALITL